MKKLLSSLILLSTTLLVHAQNTNISGVINIYADVSAITGNTITVGSTAGFASGDLILIIQMQGVTIDETNSNSFGNVVNYNSGGHYELLTICDVPNATELMVSDIQRSYEINGMVQVVRIPTYDDATVTASLTADPWNGTTGGILALKCNGDLILNDNIDVQGLGFTGAAIYNSSYSCSWLVNVSDYFYNLSTGEGALKGEGNAAYITNKTAGRGAQSNGGGGGNDHNSGGAGGGNGGMGGDGGDRIASSSFTCSGQNPGLGGKAQTYNNTENRIFLGGGGGAGHQNNAGTSFSGGNGGGIVLIIANRIIGNSQSMLANGASAATCEDGASGGGAGGTVLLDVALYTGTMIVDISGANGGDVGNVGSSNCNGPGGGGGGGVLWTSQSTTPANINLINNGGANGITTTATQSNCTVGSSNNATDGGPGIEVNDLVIPTPVPSATGTDVLTVCEAFTWLDGNTYTTDTLGATHTFVGGASSGCDSTITLDLTVISVDTSVIQEEFYLIASGPFDSIQWFQNCQSLQILTGENDDSLSTYFYAITNNSFFAVVYQNGCSDTTACYQQFYEDLDENPFSQSILLFPNPVKEKVYLDFGSLYHHISIELLDMSGRKIDKWDYVEISQIELDLDCSNGSYLLLIKSDNQFGLKKLLVD